MRVKEIGKKEIEKRFSEMNEYMKIEYLKSCLKNQLDFDTRKFVLVKLSGLFETKGMFLDAGKMMKAAADINVSKEGKIEDFIKSIELFVRGGNYDNVDIVMKKMFSLSDSIQIPLLEERVKEFYRIQGKVSVQRSKRKQAIELYERLLMFRLEENEKKEIQNRLLELYGGVGETNKYKTLKRKISG